MCVRVCVCVEAARGRTCEREEGACMCCSADAIWREMFNAASTLCVPRPSIGSPPGVGCVCVCERVCVDVCV